MGFRKVAAATRAPAVVLCDRGAFDGKAYISDDLWREVAYNTPSHSINERLLCERYDAVLHLVTAAAGAERFYTLENNLARTESVEEARKQDIQTQKAWAPHPRLCVVDNAGNGGQAKSLKESSRPARPSSGYLCYRNTRASSC